MKREVLSLATTVLVVAATFAMPAPSTAAPSGPPGATATPVGATPAAAHAQLVKRPDLVADGIGTTTLLFRVRNIGSANSPASVTRVECYSNAAGPAGDRCLPNVHYVVVPGVVLPPGTTMSGPNVWLVPVGGLDAVTGFTTFGLNIRSAPNVTNGLKFKVCADGPNTIAEFNEVNNCQWFVYSWPH
jgi:hypothetical protein